MRALTEDLVGGFGVHEVHLNFEGCFLSEMVMFVHSSAEIIECGPICMMTGIHILDNTFDPHRSSVEGIGVWCMLLV